MQRNTVTLKSQTLRGGLAVADSSLEDYDLHCRMQLLFENNSQFLLLSLGFYVYQNLTLTLVSSNPWLSLRRERSNHPLVFGLLRVTLPPYWKYS